MPEETPNYQALSVLWPALASAQQAPTTADVLARLHSGNPVGMAWAAFDAGTFQLRDTVPALITILESPPDTDAQTRDYLVAAVLDT